MRSKTMVLWMLTACLIPGCAVEQGEDAATDEPAEEHAAAMLGIEDDEQAPVQGEAASPQHAACGRVGPRLDGKRTNDAALPNTALQRSGSSTSCARLGQLNPTDDAIYFCFTDGNDGFSWTYLERVGGNRGWVRDVLLRDLGSFVPCGF